MQWVHNIKFSAESASADHAAIRNFPVESQEIISEDVYKPVQVLNANETGLFWKKMLPTIVVRKQEKSAPGFKEGKKHFNLFLCPNASSDF